MSLDFGIWVAGLVTRYNKPRVERESYTVRLNTCT